MIYYCHHNHKSYKVAKTVTPKERDFFGENRKKQLGEPIPHLQDHDEEVKSSI